MTKNSIIIFIFFLVLMGSCRSRTNFYTSGKVMEDFEPMNFDFNYLTAKARIVIEESNGKSTKGTFHLRAKKDSVVWFSMTPGLGIEAVRGIITKDRIKIKDRINNQDIDMGFDDFEEKFGIKLSLNLFENLLYANIPHEYSYRDRLLRVGKYFELTQVQDGVRYFSKISTKHGKVEELSSISMVEKGSLLASYKSYKEINSQPFPIQILLKVSIKHPEEATTNHSIIKMEMNKVEIPETPLTFPFR
jgi:hypothetical protein